MPSSDFWSDIKFTWGPPEPGTLEARLVDAIKAAMDDPRDPTPEEQAESDRGVREFFSKAMDRFFDAMSPEQLEDWKAACAESAARCAAADAGDIAAQDAIIAVVGWPAAMWYGRGVLTKRVRQRERRRVRAARKSRRGWV